ncbi:hypothetical protein BKA62DRAFT_775407 [Auriculariales sp. MPI-PUGE-AT-0066]|nr:hypothetical protein BKA62DRAFT_775407 [Auriculariales sp. MPI-PUGE-AT-0066]
MLDAINDEHDGCRTDLSINRAPAFPCGHLCQNSRPGLVVAVESLGLSQPAKVISHAPCMNYLLGPKTCARRRRHLPRPATPPYISAEIRELRLSSASSSRTSDPTLHSSSFTAWHLFSRNLRIALVVGVVVQDQRPHHTYPQLHCLAFIFKKSANRARRRRRRPRPATPPYISAGTPIPTIISTFADSFKCLSSPPGICFQEIRELRLSSASSSRTSDPTLHSSSFTAWHLFSRNLRIALVVGVVVQDQRPHHTYPQLRSLSASTSNTTPPCISAESLLGILLLEIRELPSSWPSTFKTFHSR